MNKKIIYGIVLGIGLAFSQQVSALYVYGSWHQGWAPSMEKAKSLARREARWEARKSCKEDGLKFVGKLKKIDYETRSKWSKLGKMLLYRAKVNSAKADCQ